MGIVMKTAKHYTSTPSSRSSVIEILHQRRLTDEMIDQMEIDFSWQNLPQDEAPDESNRFAAWMDELEFRTLENVFMLLFPPSKLPEPGVSASEDSHYLPKSRNPNMIARRLSIFKTFSYRT